MRAPFLDFYVRVLWSPVLPSFVLFAFRALPLSHVSRVCAADQEKQGETERQLTLLTEVRCILFLS